MSEQEKTHRLREQLAQREREWIEASHSWDDVRAKLYGRIAELESQQVRWPEPHPYPAEKPPNSGPYLRQFRNETHWDAAYYDAANSQWPIGDSDTVAWMEQPPAYVPPQKSVVEQAAEVLAAADENNQSLEWYLDEARALDAEGLLRKEGE